MHGGGRGRALETTTAGILLLRSSASTGLAAGSGAVGSVKAATVRQLSFSMVAALKGSALQMDSPTCMGVHLFVHLHLCFKLTTQCNASGVLRLQDSGTHPSAFAKVPRAYPRQLLRWVRLLVSWQKVGSKAL